MSFSAPLAAVQCCMWLAIALPSTQGEHSCHCTKFHALWCQQDHPSTPNPWNDTRTACSLICLLSHRHCLPYPTKPFGDHSKAAGQRSYRKLASSQQQTDGSILSKRLVQLSAHVGMLLLKLQNVQVHVKWHFWKHSTGGGCGPLLRFQAAPG